MNIDRYENYGEIQRDRIQAKFIISSKLTPVRCNRKIKRLPPIAANERQWILGGKTIIPDERYDNSKLFIVSSSFSYRCVSVVKIFLHRTDVNYASNFSSLISICIFLLSVNNPKKSQQEKK